MNQGLRNVHPGAKIAQNVTIESFVTIHDNVEIGEGTWIGPNVTIMEGARIGKNCRIFPGAVISAIPQDLKFNNEESLAIIGDNVTVREYCTINRGTVDKFRTVVKDNVLLMAYTHIAHDCIIGNNVVLANSVNVAGHVEIGDYTIVGGMCGIHQFVHIGEHTMIGAGIIVRKDVPPFTKAAHDPLAFIGINSIGLKRRGFPTEKITEIHEIYRVLYVMGYNLSHAIEKIEKEFKASPERDRILKFIKESDRGIMKGRHEK